MKNSFFPILTIVVFMSSCLTELMAQKPPNVLVVFLDDIGPAWFPPYAKKLKVDDLDPLINEAYIKKRTHQGPVDIAENLKAAQQCMPFLDKMAKTGVVFHRAFATASLCGPSRAGLMTGTLQQSWGVYGNADMEEKGIPENVTLLPKIFNEHGYSTAMIGKWHLSHKDPKLKKECLELHRDLKKTDPTVPFAVASWETGYMTSTDPKSNPLKLGFDYYYGFNSPGALYYECNGLWDGYGRVKKRPLGEFLTDHLNDKVIEFIDDSLKNEKPFFVYYAPMTLHGKMDNSPKKYSEQFKTGNQFTDSYAGHLLAVDDGLERIHRLLEESGVAENTIIVFSADNGQTAYEVPPYNAPHKGGKGTGWIGGLRVPLVMWGHPEILPSENQDIISLADVLPTVMEYCDIPIPTSVMGISWADYLKGRERSAPRKILFSAGLQSTRWSRGYGITQNKKDYKECPLYAWVAQGDQIYTTLSSTPKNLYFELPEGQDESYYLNDYIENPYQSVDMSKEFPEKTMKMKQALRTWFNGLQKPYTHHQSEFLEMKDLLSN